jgi:hypothetical protein
MALPDVLIDVFPTAEGAIRAECGCDIRQVA